MLQDNLRNKMHPALLTLESVPENDDNFSYQAQERSQSSCSFYRGELKSLTLTELLEALKKSRTLGRVGLMVNGEGQGGGPCIFLALLETGPLLVVRACAHWEPGQRSWWLNWHGGGGWC